MAKDYTQNKRMCRASVSVTAEKMGLTELSMCAKAESAPSKAHQEYISPTLTCKTISRHLISIQMVMFIVKHPAKVL